MGGNAGRWPLPGEIRGDARTVGAAAACSRPPLLTSGILFAVLLLATMPARAYDFTDADYLGNASAFGQWASTLERQQALAPVLSTCREFPEACRGLLRPLAHLLNRSVGLSPERQVQLVNRYVNRRHYRYDRRRVEVDAASGDRAIYRSSWGTVMDFLRRGGDCEDYASTKYFLLRELGFRADDLRIVVLYERPRRDYHAVLAVRFEDDQVWLLESDDSITRRRSVTHRYIYALNEHAVWDHEGRAG